MSKSRPLFEEYARCFQCTKCGEKIHEAYFNSANRKCNRCCAKNVIPECCPADNIRKEKIIPAKCCIKEEKIPIKCCVREEKIPIKCCITNEIPECCPVDNVCEENKIPEYYPIDDMSEEKIIPEYACRKCRKIKCCCVVKQCYSGIWERCVGCYNVFCINDLFRNYCNGCRKRLN